tara:strand:- start:5262 stop:6035 length:774 start_codon:yes stop_codon:yes gene_type:complete
MMTIPQKKKLFLDTYRDTYGNLTDTLKITEIKPSEYNKFMELPDFRREIDAVQQLRIDLIDSKFLELIAKGDSRAIIDAKKMEVERKSGINLEEMRQKVMVYLITHASTKTEALTAYCDWFKVAESTGDSFYKKAIVEHGLKDSTPIARAKSERKKIESSLSSRFKNNNLSEIEMLQGLLEQALYTAETAEYPSERATASKEAREIGRRMEEIQERERVKNTFNNEEWVDIIDAIVLDSNIEEVKALKQKQMLIEGE